MDKGYGHDDDISSLQKKIQELEKKHQDASLVVASTAAQISAAKKSLEEKKKISELKDVNDKLSDYAQNAMQDTEGPLTPYQLFKFLMNDDFGKQNKEIITNIRKYSNDITAVREQVSKVREKVETHTIYMKKQKELDDRFTKKLMKMDNSVKEELAKEMLVLKVPLIEKSQKFRDDVRWKNIPDPAMFSPGYSSQLMFETRIPIVKCSGIRKLMGESGNLKNDFMDTKIGIGKLDPPEFPFLHPAYSIQPIFEKRVLKRIRKNNSVDELENSENGIMKVKTGIRKRLRLNSPENIYESSQNAKSTLMVESVALGNPYTESMSMAYSNSRHTEPMSLADSISPPPMSVAYSSSSGPMSIADSSSSGQMSVADSISPAPMSVADSISPAPMSVADSISPAPMSLADSISPAPMSIADSISSTPMSIADSMNPEPMSLVDSSIQHTCQTFMYFHQQLNEICQCSNSIS